MTSIDLFSKNIYRELKDTWKDTQHHKLSGKCKIKPWWGISHLLEQLLSKRQERSVGEDVEEREQLGTVGGNVNWCGHYREQYGDFLRNEK